jgi:predicted dehydrogenase
LKDKALRFGVVGMNFGRQLVRTLANMEEADLVAIASPHDAGLPGGLTGYAAKYNARAYKNGLEMLQKETLDAVCIATMPKGREPMLEHAVKNKIALFVEKPWSATVEQGRRMIEICRAAVAPVMTAFSFRYHPAIAKLRELIQGDLGAVLALNGEYLFDWRPGPNLWDAQKGNGFINENSCHLFDGIMSLVGDPDTVSAEAINPFGMPAEHAAAMTMRFTDGAIAALTVGGIGASGFHRTHRLDVVTVNGQASLEAHDHVWETIRWTLRGREETQSLALRPEQLGNTRYTDALRHFIHCIRSGTAPQTGPLEGLKCVALAMAAVESARSGRKVEVKW